MNRLLLEAQATLALIELISATEPTSNNVWNVQAIRLRAALNQLKAALAASDTTGPTHTAQTAV